MPFCTQVAQTICLDIFVGRLHRPILHMRNLYTAQRLTYEGDEITISFLPVPSHKGQELVENKTVEVEENPDPPKENNVPVKHPKSGERPDTGKVYDLKQK